MKHSLIVGSLLALIIPLSVSALSVDEIRAQIQTLMQQIQQLQEQIKTLSVPTPVACTMDAKVCPDGSSVGRVGPHCEFAACPGGGGTDTTLPAWCTRYGNLIFGARGQEVSALQAEIGEEVLGSVPTGYYGSLTRAVWNKRCHPRPIDCSTVKVKTTCSTGETLVGYESYVGGCGGVICRPVAVGGVTISGVSGPTSLAVNQQGKWEVQASSQANSTLSYSVVWGDEDSLSRIMAFAEGGNTFVQTATFTHAYASAGTYKVRFIVRDAVGATAETSLTVRVGGLECPVYNRPECLNGRIENVVNERGCNEPRCVVSNCPIPMCSASALVCPAGQHVAPAMPVYGVNGCQTNWCAQRCVSDVICAGPLAEGGFVHSQCPVLPIGNTAANGAEKQEPIQGGFADNSKTCAANGMIFAEGASVSQCIASGGANGCNTFSVVEPRFVCRGGAWVQ